MVDYITGSTGFIGKRLMQKIGDGALTVRHEDIHDTAFPDCDRFFFLSTYGNMSHQDDISEIIRSNIGHLGYVLEAYIEEAKCNHFTFISSSSVNLPVQTAYSRAKRCGEEMVLVSHIPAAIIRPFSVFGINEQPSHLIPTLLRSCFEGEVVKFASSPVHDWISVDDVVDGILMLADCRETGIFELGTGRGRTNAEVLRTIQTVSGKHARIVDVDNVRSYDNAEWVCRTTLPGWKPKRDFIETIAEVVEDYRRTPEKYAK